MIVRQRPFPDSHSRSESLLHLILQSTVVQTVPQTLVQHLSRSIENREIRVALPNEDSRLPEEHAVNAQHADDQQSDPRFESVSAHLVLGLLPWSS